MTLSDDLAKATHDAQVLEAALSSTSADRDAKAAALAAAQAEVARLTAELEDCHAHGEFVVGISPGQWLGYSPDDQDRQLDAMAAIGLGAMRVAPEWSGLEPKAGEFHFDRLVDVCERIEAHDFEVCICPTYPPVHARVDPAARYSAPKVASVRTMAKALGTATAHLKSRKREWTNEPNLLYWNPPNPLSYAPTLDAFLTSITAGDPKAEVVTAGLAPAKQNPPKSWRGPEFLAEVYRTAKCCAPGAPVKIAGVGWHPYMGGQPPTTVASWSTMTTLWDAMVAVIGSRPAPRPPIVSTEWGYSTGNPAPLGNGVSEDLQARYIVDQLDVFRKRATSASPVYLHRLIDFAPGQIPGGTAYNEELGIHWFAGDVAASLAKPKKAVAALREYLT